jgi:hypothetical protein
VTIDCSRHGRSSWNIGGLIDSREADGLSPRACARFVRQRFAERVAQEAEREGILVQSGTSETWAVIRRRIYRRDGDPHRGRVPLPKRGAAFDFGEEEGNGAKRRPDHRPYTKASSAGGQSRPVAGDGSERGSIDRNRA